MSCEVTGERLLEVDYRQSIGGYAIYLMHLASYRFAEPYCRGKRVLDLGCGSGYGSAILAETADRVMAVDVSDDAIAFASDHYTRENLNFSRIKPGSTLPFESRSFDVVISFQVLEHVEDDHAYLVEAARVLSDGGRLILVTPDRRHRLLPFQKPWNRWHLREYSAKGLQHLVSESFNVEKFLCMGADPKLGELELKRYRWLKWFTLPFTLPVLPEAWRKTSLNALHGLGHWRKKPRTSSMQPPELSFDESAVYFDSTVERSLNLLIIGRPRR